MAIQFPDFGERKLLNAIKESVGTVDFKLYANDHTPGDGDIGTDYTEATGTWYASHQFTFYSLFLPAVTNSNVSSITSQYILHWAHDGVSDPINIYGWYAQMSDDQDTVLMAERFAGAPVGMSAAEHYIDIIPKISLSDTAD